MKTVDVASAGSPVRDDQLSVPDGVVAEAAVGSAERFDACLRLPTHPLHGTRSATNRTPYTSENNHNHKLMTKFAAS